MESITSDLKVRIFQGDSSVKRIFKIRKLSDGTVVLDDGIRCIVQRPKFHRDRFQTQQPTRMKKHIVSIATFKSVFQLFITKSVSAVAAQIPAWSATQLQSSVLSHFIG